MNELPIFYEEKPVATLLQNDRGFCELRYEAEWQRHGFDISVTLPRAQQHHTGDVVRAFFENLLPEASIRESLARHYGVSTENIFALLTRIGRDCAGAFSIGGPGNKGEYLLLTEPELQAELDKLPQYPMASARPGTSLSLAGAQHKLPIFRKENEIYLPLHGAASNSIIKLPIAAFPHSVENEFFCMRLAQRIGLPVAGTEILSLPKEKVLLVERYDREGSDFYPQRLPQEDFCQMLGLSSAVKYESEGGPTFADCADYIRRYSFRSAKDLLRLVQWAAFNLCIGNNDAHAKNLSMLRQGNALSLAPHYDLISTTFYGRRLQKKLAMRIGGQQWSHHVSRRRWGIFADAVGLPQTTVLLRVASTANAILRALPPVAELARDSGVSPDVSRALQSHIEERTRKVLQHLQE